MVTTLAAIHREAYGYTMVCWFLSGGRLIMRLRNVIFAIVSGLGITFFGALPLWGVVVSALKPQCNSLILGILVWQVILMPGEVVAGWISKRDPFVSGAGLGLLTTMFYLSVTNRIANGYNMPTAPFLVEIIYLAVAGGAGGLLGIAGGRWRNRKGKEEVPKAE